MEHNGGVDPMQPGSHSWPVEGQHQHVTLVTDHDELR